MSISASRYLAKGAFCFIKVTRDDKKINENSKKVEMVSDLEEKRKKNALHKKKKDVQTLLLVATCSSTSAVLMLLFGSFSSWFVSAIFVPKTSVQLSTSASIFVISVNVSRYAFLSLSISAMSILVSGSFFFPFASIIFMPVPRLSALLSTFIVFMAVPKFSAPLLCL